MTKLLQNEIFTTTQNSYQTTHFVQNSDNSCPGCPYITQTIEHFALKCKTSKQIWEQSYKLLKNNKMENPPTS
ncbi:19334_t:CDS:2, partial [Cetraspora pellucida]